MSEEIVPEDLLARHEEVLTWYRLAEKHVFPPVDSPVALATQIQNWQALKSKDSKLEKDLLPLYRQMVRQLKARIDRAVLECDTAFIHALNDAAALVKSGKVSQPLDTPGAAVYAIRELRDKLGRRPHHQEVRKQVEQWRKEGGYDNDGRITEDTWRRVLKIIKPLLRLS
jgi:hypothetical protein